MMSEEEMHKIKYSPLGKKHKNQDQTGRLKKLLIVGTVESQTLSLNEMCLMFVIGVFWL